MRYRIYRNGTENSTTNAGYIPTSFLSCNRSIIYRNLSPDSLKGSYEKSAFKLAIDL